MKSYHLSGLSGIAALLANYAATKLGMPIEVSTAVASGLVALAWWGALKLADHHHVLLDIAELISNKDINKDGKVGGDLHNALLTGSIKAVKDVLGKLKVKPSKAKPAAELKKS